MNKGLRIWGTFFGVVIGFVISKIYQIWAILFRGDGMHYAGVKSWHATTLWEIATEHPEGFLITIEILFGVIGYIFVNTCYIKKDQGV